MHASGDRINASRTPAKQLGSAPMQATAYSDGRFVLDGREMRCALGSGGAKPAADKREGDGATPLGVWPIRRALYRADRLERPETVLPLRAIRPDDGWCDAPGDPAYNRPVRLPYPASAETLTRDDPLYDVIVVLGHNDDPPAPNAGSAIFLHCMKENYKPTLGCVASAREDVLDLLARAAPGDLLEIREA